MVWHRAQRTGRRADADEQGEWSERPQDRTTQWVGRRAAPDRQ